MIYYNPDFISDWNMHTTPTNPTEISLKRWKNVETIDCSGFLYKSWIRNSPNNVEKTEENFNPSWDALLEGEQSCLEN